jgi:hypothetical protein
MNLIHVHRHVAAPAYYLGRPRSFYEQRFGRRSHRDDSGHLPPAA